MSQFNEVDFRGALAFTVTACLVSVVDHAIAAMIEIKRKFPLHTSEERP